jgi:hypothetical protein
MGDHNIGNCHDYRFPDSGRYLVVVNLKELPDDFMRKIILRTGPIVAATRPLIWNKKLKRYVKGHVTGSVTNYDDRVTRFSSDEQARRVIADERARWHYYKSFSDRFTPEEWQ